MGVFPIFGVTLLFAIRTYHLYERNKALLAAMLFAAAGQVGGMLAVSFIETRSVPIGNGIKACIPTSSGDLFVLYWVFPTVNIGLVTILSLAKSFKLVKVTDPSASLVDKTHQVMFSKYGQIFPICVAMICITQVIFYLVANEMKRAVSFLAKITDATANGPADLLTSFRLAHVGLCMPDGSHRAAHRPHSI